ncbi:iron-sulfur cluster assembly protein [Candidatus Latescibacterota bacterium]
MASIEYAEGSIEAQVVEVIRTCYDPEIPVDIYELGLIYAISVNDEKAVTVTMTLTSPMCPVAGSLPPEVRQKIRDGVTEASEVTVDLVWDPPWSVDRMSEAAKLQLGML